MHQGEEEEEEEERKRGKSLESEKVENTSNR